MLVPTLNASGFLAFQLPFNAIIRCFLFDTWSEQLLWCSHHIRGEEGGGETRGEKKQSAKKRISQAVKCGVLTQTIWWNDRGKQPWRDLGGGLRKGSSERRRGGGETSRGAWERWAEISSQCYGGREEPGGVTGDGVGRRWRIQWEGGGRGGGWKGGGGEIGRRRDGW